MKINDTDFEHAAEFETRVREVISKLRVLLDDIGDKNEDKVVASGMQQRICGAKVGFYS